MKIIMRQELEVKTEDGSFRLIYELLSSHFPCGEDVKEKDYFGIRIRQYGIEGGFGVEGSEIPGVTENYEEAMEIFQLFVRETVMPVHLYELVDDWQTALCLKE